MKEINEDLRKWLKERWVDISKTDESGNHPPCGRKKSKRKGYPKCRPAAEAARMSKGTKKKAVAQKRRAESTKQREGKKPISVSHKKLDEELLLEKNTPTNPGLWSQAVAQAKKRFKVYPSAYANLWASKWYKKKGGSWKSGSETNESLTKLGMGASVASALMGFGAAKLQSNQPQYQAPQSQQAEVHPDHEDFKSIPPAADQETENKKKIYHHDAIRAMVIQDEGIKTKPYRDTRGILTVGIGHNLEAPNSRASFIKAFGENEGKRLHSHAKAGGELTADHAKKLFEADYEEHLNRTVKMIPNLHEHPPEVQAVLVSGTYRGHVGDSPTFRKMFNSGNYSDAAKEVLNRKEYKNPARNKKGKIIAPGVLTRLERDSKVLGDYANSKAKT